MSPSEAFALLALITGLAISGAGVAGVFRFPDVYTRLNAVAKVSTAGAVLVHLSLGALMPAGQGGKALLTALMLLLTTPVVTQVISQMAHRMRVPDANHVDDLRAAQDAAGGRP